MTNKSKYQKKLIEIVEARLKNISEILENLKEAYELEYMPSRLNSENILRIRQTIDCLLSNKISVSLNNNSYNKNSIFVKINNDNVFEINVDDITIDSIFTDIPGGKAESVIVHKIAFHHHAVCRVTRESSNNYHGINVIEDSLIVKNDPSESISHPGHAQIEKNTSIASKVVRDIISALENFIIKEGH